MKAEIFVVIYEVNLLLKTSAEVRRLKPLNSARQTYIIRSLNYNALFKRNVFLLNSLVLTILKDLFQQA